MNNVQQLNLQKSGCLYDFIIQHEFLHALGFHHQQSAYDRDNYVTVYKENIANGTVKNSLNYHYFNTIFILLFFKGNEHNFVKIPSTMNQYFGTSYDYKSVMHYDSYAFSKNGQITIALKVKQNFFTQTLYITLISQFIF